MSRCDVWRSRGWPASIDNLRATEAARYFRRHGYAPAPELPAPDPDLGLVVVVPALAEPDLIATAESVNRSRYPECAVELLLLVNAADDADAAIRRVNRDSLVAAQTWADGSCTGRFRCHALDYRDLPAREAGVGLARKIGMDIALARLAASRRGRGVIVSLDADCRVDATYLETIADYFRQHPDAVGATIYFEHPLDTADTDLRAAIVDYELHLRCYRYGLLHAGSAYAHYTVGSAFAVRSEIYAQEGGMNRRRAGEDFYFLNKLLKRGHVGEINGTGVFPAARLSARVPFGTGAALRRAADAPVMTYAPGVYPALAEFLVALAESVRQDRSLSARYAPFVAQTGFDGWLTATRANVASEAALMTQLTRWMDGFKTLKFIHWLTGSDRPKVPVPAAARDIARWHGLNPAAAASDLLRQFRELDRERR